jgi:hypothetical protein
MGSAIERTGRYRQVPCLGTHADCRWDQDGRQVRSEKAESMRQVRAQPSPQRGGEIGPPEISVSEPGPDGEIKVTIVTRHHVSEVHEPGCPIFNLIVGHYREALVKDPDAIMLDIVPSAMNNLLGVRSFESIVLILIGLFIFGFAFYKGYKVWDTYPGYMSKHRALRDAETRLKDERDHVSRGADIKLGPQIQEFEKIGSVLSSKRAELDALLQKIDGELSSLYGKFDQIEQAGSVTMKIYRAANEQVRSPRVPPPAYFKTEFKLERPTNLPELREVRTEHAAAIEQVTAVERAFQSAQADIAAEKASITRQLDEVSATAEKSAKDRAAAEREEEEALRKALGTAPPRPTPE